MASPCEGAEVALWKDASCRHRESLSADNKQENIRDPDSLKVGTRRRTYAQMQTVESDEHITIG
jgi:hypothetical protein